MKKLILAFLCLCICFSFSACKEKSEKRNISNQHIQYSKRLIEIADQYIDYDITAEEAHNKIDDLKKRSAEITDAKPGTDDYFAGSTIQNCMWGIELAINRSDFSPSSESVDDIKEHRNKLAEFIGEEIRK